MKKAMRHQYQIDCCSYSGQTLVEKRLFPDVEKIDTEFDPFHEIVTSAMKKRYNAIFDSGLPQDGLLSEEKVRNYLEDYLPVSSVDKIWSLSDQDGDGCLDRYEWTVANHITRRVLSYGVPIPDQVNYINH